MARRLPFPLVMVLLLSALGASSAWGEPLPPLQARGLKPGLVATVYPRHATQTDENGAFVEPDELGPAVRQPGNPYLVKSLADWKFPADFNAVAEGYLKVDVPGEYAFVSNNFYDRNVLIVDGKMICPYRDGERTVATIALERGFYPIKSVGYFRARGSVQVTCQPPGGTAQVAIPENLLFHLPQQERLK